MAKTRSKVEQVSEEIRRLIAANAFTDGRLPSEPELTGMMDASRATVRQALAKIELDGLIIRKHGSGTFVNQRVKSIDTRLDEVWDFEEMIALAGYNAHVSHEEMSLDAVPAHLTEILALNPEDQVLTTANVFLAEAHPVIFCLDVIPAGLVKHAYQAEELHGPVYTFLAHRCQQQVDYNITKILPVVADRAMARRLACSTGAPLHYFEEVGYNADHLPVIYSETYYRPDFFDFRVVRKMTTRQPR